MTENHSYNTPQQGAQDWNVPVNENFEAMDAHAPIVDADAARSNYTPKQDALFVATDTGERYVGDGSQWVGLPVGDSSTSTSTLVDSTPNLVIQQAGGTVELTDGSGTVISSGGAQSVFVDMRDRLGDGDHVHISSGEYRISGNISFEKLTDVTITSDAVVVWDHNDDSRGTELFRFSDTSGLRVIGGVWDGNRQNNPSCTAFGCSGIIRISSSDGFEFGHCWMPNGNRWAMSIANPQGGRIHHCYFSNTKERGIYPKGGSNLEIDHNAFVDIDRGAIRVKNDATAYHIHDNFYFMGSDHPYNYILHNGVRDFVIERETSINYDMFGFISMKNTGDDGEPIHNMTFRDCYYHARPGTGATFDSFSTEDIDLSSFTWDNVNVLNMDVETQSVRDAVNLL